MIQNNVWKIKYVLLINYVIYVNNLVIYKPNVTFYSNIFNFLK